MGINYQEIGRRIASRRRFLGLRQSQVCERCEINSNYLSNIEHAKSIPSIDVLLRICSALDATPDMFLLGTRSGEGEALARQVAERVQGFDGRKLELLMSFMDWLQEQDFSAP